MHIHLTEKGQKLMEEKIYPVIEADEYAYHGLFLFPVSDIYPVPANGSMNSLSALEYSTSD